MGRHLLEGICMTALLGNTVRGLYRALFRVGGGRRLRAMAASAGCMAACLVPSVQAGPVLERVLRDALVRVCIWPQYYGVTFRHPHSDALTGIDIDLSMALGRDLKVRVEYVDSSFPALVRDLVSERCDVAMFAIGKLPQRLEYLSFTDAYLQSDIYAVTTKSNAVVRRWSDIDRAGVVVGVQAGTFMEPVMARTLRQARLVRIQAPATRERELMAGRIDVFMTDYPYGRQLLDNADWARLLEPPQPVSVTRYGYAVKPGDAGWLATVNDFVQRIKQDGRLQQAAEHYGLGALVVR